MTQRRSTVSGASCGNSAAAAYRVGERAKSAGQTATTNFLWFLDHQHAPVHFTSLSIFVLCLSPRLPPPLQLSRAPMGRRAPHSLKTSALKQHFRTPWEIDRKTDIWLRSPMRKNPLESNINKNNVNAEALEMWSADSAQPCLITVHLGQRPNGRLGCGPRQTTFHLASTARKSQVWLMQACWCRRSTRCKDKLQRQATTREFSLTTYLHRSKRRPQWWNHKLKCQRRSISWYNGENAHAMAHVWYLFWYSYMINNLNMFLKGCWRMCKDGASFKIGIPTVFNIIFNLQVWCYWQCLFVCACASTHAWVIRRLPRAGCNTLATWQIWNRVSIIVCHLDPVLLICPTKVLIEITGKTAPVKYSIAGLPSITENRDCGWKMVLVSGLIIFLHESTITCLLGWQALICNV